MRKENSNQEELTLYADFVAKQGQFARSVRIERTTSGLISLSTYTKT